MNVLAFQVEKLTVKYNKNRHNDPDLIFEIEKKKKKAKKERSKPLHK